MGLLGFFLFMFLFLPSVSAFYLPSVRTGMESVVSSLIDIFEPILRALFGGIDWSGAVLFEKLLVFILLVAVIYVVTKRIPLFSEQNVVRWIVAIVIPLIGVRFIEMSAFFAIFTQYSIFSIIITSVVPFIIYFYFLYNIAGVHGIIRKIGWLVFVGIYIGLWSTSDTSSSSSIFFWTFVVGLVMLFGDNTINKKLEAVERFKTDKHALEMERASVRREIDRIREDIRASRITQSVGKEMLNDKEKYLKYLNKRFG